MIIPGLCGNLLSLFLHSLRNNLDGHDAGRLYARLPLMTNGHESKDTRHLSLGLLDDLHQGPLGFSTIYHVIHDQDAISTFERVSRNKETDHHSRPRGNEYFLKMLTNPNLPVLLRNYQHATQTVRQKSRKGYSIRRRRQDLRHSTPGKLSHRGLNSTLKEHSVADDRCVVEIA